MADGKKGYYGTNFDRPQTTLGLKKLKTKKRALQDQDRLCEESPSKKTKTTPKKQVRRPFGALPPPPNDDASEDSSLINLVNLKHPPGTFKLTFNTTSGDKTPSKLSTSLYPCPTASSMSPVPRSMSNISCISPTSVYYNAIHLPQSNGNSNPSCFQSLQTPPQIVAKRRQTLTPAPATASPSWSNIGGNGTPTKSGVFGGIRGASRANLGEKFDAAGKEKWSETPCLDWSLKTRLTLIANKPFGWNSTSLKSSEESSGTSAFVRCIDIDPINKGSVGISPQGSQLDTSLGAQFHQCCLYWQHPSLPAVNLFPRDLRHLGPLSSSPLNGLRLEEKILDSMLMEWTEAFLSLFRLLRTRQCPYFYICANQFTALFCAAGTQGLDYLQIYITPSSKGFRDALKTEGIEFSMPFYTPEENSANASSTRKRNVSLSSDKGVESDDEGADKWLYEMGISQDVSLSTTVKSTPVSQAEEKSKSTLVSIAGNDTLAFFNFLINSKSLLVATTGPFAGLPPTILSPAAFHGATLKSLKVKQAKVNNSNGDTTFSIEVNGPILPHVIATLCPLLQKTVEDFKIQTATLGSTVNLNINSREMTLAENDARANAFELQNLSDCGLKKSILDLFCRSDIIDTIHERIECRNNMFQWS